jgi:uncharacterized protein (DUF1697 family)
MNTYVALFRGINVGGRNRLPMRELVDVLRGMGLQGIRTYIQSGNVVFQSDATDTLRLGESISVAVSESHGFSPRVLVLTLDEFEAAAESNPFPEAVSDHKTLHLYFLSAEPENPDLEALESIRADSERFTLQGKVFYLHAPDGIGRSRLAARVEKALGVAATARNWRSVTEIMAMAKR